MLVFEDVLPRSFLVGDSQNVHEDRLLEVYYDSELDPLRQVLLVMPVSMKKTENFSGQVEELSYPPNGVNVKTNQNGEGFLVLLDTWFSGLQVTFDIMPKPIYRANSFYCAVKLGLGNHSIEFSYVSVGLKNGSLNQQFCINLYSTFIF